jgi:hypothetical protein
VSTRFQHRSGSAGIAIAAVPTLLEADHSTRILLNGFRDYVIGHRHGLPAISKGCGNARALSASAMSRSEQGVPANEGLRRIVGDEIQIGVTSEGSANQQEIARRREIVRQFFNDFWRSPDDKPSTFAERLN